MPKDGYPGPIVDIVRGSPSKGTERIPFEQPPPGVTPNFENPPTLVPVILGASIPFFVIATICLAIRAYAKVVITRKWRSDDSLVTLGYLGSIAYLSSVIVRCRHGAVGRHGWDTSLKSVFGHAGLVTNVVCTIMTPFTLGLIKLSLLAQYYYVFGLVKHVRISVFIMAPLVALLYFSVTATALALNVPWPGESFADVTLSNRPQKFVPFSVPGGAIGTIMDWIILVIPMPAIWNLRVSRKRRIGPILVFMTGGLGAIASAVSLYYRVSLFNNPRDITWKKGYVFLWVQIEMWCGITASCMPSVKQVASYYISKSYQESQPGPSISWLRRSTHGKIPNSRTSFRKWGYKSSTQTESATHIVSSAGDIDTERQAHETIAVPARAHTR